ncbi:hypothetical protein [Desulfoscipio gibsoniae]|uniref:Uncharacterized protein n=1 Tax=Desulfoscipio gibsoniae DSM 7213 TaxID=767817 RepID=R4KHZ2_9FIRM|nr:hypothetical protein [Desulfoscipio gibsoniae]AGL00130.1 hypothetical protein Desgi_0568 [Desulfoscipio gibsoniae DSM 7213]
MKVFVSFILVAFLVHVFLYWVFRSAKISEPTETQRLNCYLSEYDFDERHNIVIQSSPEKVFEAIYNLDMSKSKVIKPLLSLRSIPYRLSPDRKPEKQEPSGLSIEQLIKNGGFFLLEEIKNQEIVIGLVGKFWHLTADMIQLSNVTNFTNFNQTGYGKVAWNFYIEQNADGTVTLSTETRILCLGEQAKSSFRLYWAVIRPYSGWIRIEMLKMIKEQVEK